MSIFDKAKGIAGEAVDQGKHVAGSVAGKGKDVAGSVAGKGKELAGGVIGTVKDRIGGDHDESAPVTDTGDGASSDASSTETPNAEAPHDVVTPADVAEAVSDPDLPHPEPPTEMPS